MTKLSLNSNQLKIIAIIAMIIDHIGNYFYFAMSDTIFILFRSIGRISMPIFVFLIVQGYLKTSNIKRYITRIFKFAVITQMCILIVALINAKFVPNYNMNIYDELNILFSFALSLCLIYVIDTKNKLSNSNMLNLIIKLAFVVIIITIYYFINIDYKFIVPIMAVEMFYITRIINKNTSLNKCIYNILLISIIYINSNLQMYLGVFSTIAAIFIILYNGELGKKSNILKKTFYYIFPIQHTVLYLLAMLYFIK